MDPLLPTLQLMRSILEVYYCDMGESLFVQINQTIFGGGPLQRFLRFSACLTVAFLKGNSDMSVK